MNIKILSIVVTSLFLLGVLELTRREKLTFKYSFAWMGMCVLAIFFEVFDNYLVSIAAMFGFELASNFIFYVLLSVFVLLTLLLTVFLCQQNDRNNKMAQKIGQLELEIEKLKRDKG